MSPLKVCSYSNIMYKNGNSEKHIIEMADQSIQESRKRIVNFYLGNKEKGRSFTCAFFKKAGFCKEHGLPMFSRHLRIKKNNKEEGWMWNNLPQAPSTSLQVLRQVTGRGISCKKLGLKLNCMWCFNCQQH